MAEPWVSIEQVAAHLGVRRDSVYRWIEHRRLPATKVGKLWKLKLSEVDAWVRAAREPEKETPRVVARHRTVLVVDDDRVHRENLEDFLSDAGYRVLLASDGNEALAILRDEPGTCLVILDLGMPNMDGWRFRQQQVREPNIATVPVLVLTADPRATLKGVHATLRKPLKLREVRAVLDRVAVQS